MVFKFEIWVEELMSSASEAKNWSQDALSILTANCFRGLTAKLNSEKYKFTVWYGWAKNYFIYLCVHKRIGLKLKRIKHKQYFRSVESWLCSMLELSTRTRQSYSLRVDEQKRGFLPKESKASISLNSVQQSIIDSVKNYVQNQWLAALRV